MFVIAAVAVLGGFLAFVWQRVAVAPGWRSRAVPWVTAVVLLVLLAFSLEGFDVWGGAWSADTMRPVAWTGQFFLALCLYLFLGLTPVWLASVVIWVTRWGGDHARTTRRRLNRVMSPLVVVGALAVTGFGAYEAANPSITRYEVSSPDLPPAFDGMTIALVTDIHAGAVRSAGFTQHVVDLVNAQHPSLVVVAGDLEDGTVARYGADVQPVSGLSAPLGVFVTTGNHEMFRDTASWVAAYRSYGLTVLANQSVPLTRDGASICLAGVHDLVGSGVFAPDNAAALAGCPKDGYTIFVAHQPRVALQIAGQGVDLQLSGHTHGGQMWPIGYLVPLQQPVVDGFHTVDGVPVLTSRGVGAWGPPVRVGAPPEIPLITLRRS